MDYGRVRLRTHIRNFFWTESGSVAHEMLRLRIDTILSLISLRILFCNGKRHQKAIINLDVVDVLAVVGRYFVN